MQQQDLTVWRTNAIALMNSGPGGTSNSFTRADFAVFAQASRENSPLAGMPLPAIIDLAIGVRRSTAALGDQLEKDLAGSVVPPRGRRWARGMAAVLATDPAKVR